MQALVRVWSNLKGNCHEQFKHENFSSLIQGGIDARQNRPHMTGLWITPNKRDNSKQKSRFRERKVARKPGMLPQTTLPKCMRSSWQFPFNSTYQLLM